VAQQHVMYDKNRKRIRKVKSPMKEQYCKFKSRCSLFDNISGDDNTNVYKPLISLKSDTRTSNTLRTNPPKALSHSDFMLLAGFQFFGTDSWQDIVGNFPFPKEGFETFDDVKAQIRFSTLEDNNSIKHCSTNRTLTILDPVSEKLYRDFLTSSEDYLKLTRRRLCENFNACGDITIQKDTDYDTETTLSSEEKENERKNKQENEQKNEQEEEPVVHLNLTKTPVVQSQSKSAKGTPHCFADRDDCALLGAVEKYGVGNWSKILENTSFPSWVNRSAQLKNRFRYLTKRGLIETNEMNQVIVLDNTLKLLYGFIKKGLSKGELKHNLG